MRVRKRLAAPIALAAALLSLAACRSSPEVAAYVGDTQITEQQVTDVQESTVFVTEDGTSTEPIGRQRVVETMVMNKLCEDSRAKKTFEKLNIQPTQLVEAQGEIPASMRPQEPAAPAAPEQNPTEEQKRELQQQEQERQERFQRDGENWQRAMADSSYLKLRADALSCVYAIPLSGQPTEEEFRALFDRAVAVGVYPAGTRYQDVEANLRSDQVVSNLLAHRELTKLIDEGGVTINPRYEPLVIPLLTGAQDVIVLGAELGEPNEVVEEQ